MTSMYYDRDLDVAWFGDPNAEVHTSAVLAWGIEDHDAAGNVVGIAVWNASHQLPAFLLVHLPRPKAHPALATHPPTDGQVEQAEQKARDKGYLVAGRWEWHR